MGADHGRHVRDPARNDRRDPIRDGIDVVFFVAHQEDREPPFLEDALQIDGVGPRLVGGVAVDGIKDVRTYPDYIQLLADVRAGRIDVAMIDPPSIAYQIAAHGITGIKRVENYTPVNAWKIGLAVNKGDKDLLDAINGSLKKLKASGQLKKILDGWGVGHLIAN